MFCSHHLAHSLAMGILRLNGAASVFYLDYAPEVLYMASHEEVILESIHHIVSDLPYGLNVDKRRGRC